MIRRANRPRQPIRFDLTQPGSKEGLRYLNTLHNEGLMQRDWALAPDQKEFESALSSGYLGSFTGNRLYPWFYNLMPAIRENDPDAYWVPIDPFRNKVGETPKSQYTPSGIHIVAHDGYVNTNGVVDAYIEDTPRSYIDKRPLLEDKMEEIMTRAILAAPEDFDDVFDAGYRELVDLGIMGVKEELLAAFDSQ